MFVINQNLIKYSNHQIRNCLPKDVSIDFYLREFLTLCKWSIIKNVRKFRILNELSNKNDFKLLKKKKKELVIYYYFYQIEFFG